MFSFTNAMAIPGLTAGVHNSLSGLMNTSQDRMSLAFQAGQTGGDTNSLFNLHETDKNLESQMASNRMLYSIFDTRQDAHIEKMRNSKMKSYLV